MGAEKLSISMDSSLLKLARDAAAAEGVSLSTWLSDAARARARQRALCEALEDQAGRHGPLSLEQAEQIVAGARRGSRISRRKRA